METTSQERKIHNLFLFHKTNGLAVFITLSATLFFVPFFVLGAPPPLPIQTLYNKLVLIVNAVIVFFIGIAFVYFLYGVFKYIYAASTEGKEGARMTIIYGLIGLFVMLAAWGLVNVLLGTFGFTATNTEAPKPNELPKGFK